MQQPFRFVHAADLHIDSPFRGLREVAPEIAERLQDATFRAFRNLIDLCIREKAAFLVIAGDVYDGADRSVRAQRAFQQGLARLGEQGIQTFVVHGNHDPLNGWIPSIRLSDSVHTFGPEAEWAEARRDGTLIARVQGVSFPTPEVRDNLARDFGTAPQDGVFSIGLLHCNIGAAASGHENYAPCTVEDLEQTGIDYWALGHVHTCAVLRDEGPTIVYPGNTQGRHANETGARGCMVVCVDAAGGVTTRFEPLDVVRWEQVEVPVDGMATLDDLFRSISEGLEAVAREGDGRDLVCRVRLTGRGPVHRQLAREADLSGVTGEVRGQMTSAQPWVWVEKIVDETRAEIDLDVCAAQDDFLGHVLRGAAALDPDAVRSELSAEVFSGARGRLPPPKDAELTAIVDDARWYLAELLEPEA